MELSLRGKVALVTGASSGLGRHFGALLAREGATVVLAARSADRLASLRDELRGEGHSAHAVRLDVTDEASVEAAFAEIDALGLVADVIVNNAGVTSTMPAAELPTAEWSRVVDTNLTGCFTVARLAAGRMIAAGRGGAIVNVASIVGLRVAGHLAHYAAAKAGLLQLTKALALEWARHGIRVNALAPGYIETELNAEFFRSDAGKALIRRIPQRRLGRPEDLDGPLLLLASDAAGYMTGAVVAADGGHLVSSL